MGKKRIWLRILTMALLFGMTVAGCDNGSTNNEENNKENSDPKSITVTGISGESGYAYIVVRTGLGNSGIVAYEWGIISYGSVTFYLLKYPETTNPWTGSGSYNIVLGFDPVISPQDPNNVEFASEYVYTNGKEMADLGITSYNVIDILSKAPKYTISSTASAITFNQFRKIK